MSTGHTPSPLAFQLRAFTPAQAALTRHFGEPGLAVDGDDAGWRLSMGTEAPPAVPLRLDLQAAACRAEVIVDARPYPALHALAQEPDAARRTALGNLLLAPWLASAPLGDTTLAALELLDRATPPSAPALPVRLDGPAALDLRIGRLDWHPAPPAPPLADRAMVLSQLAALAMPASLRIATRRCRTEVLATLAPGDVVLGWGETAATLRRADRGPVHLRWGNARHLHLAAAAHYQEGAVTLLDIPQPTADDHRDPQSDHDGSAAFDDDATPVAIEALEVPVHLELAVMAMPLAELAALQAGHVLQLPVRIADASVRLVCHGQTVGHGRLVAVGEQLGLELSTIGARHADR